MLTYDVLIIGARLAGMRAALEAGQTTQVAIISKVYPTRSHGGAAQGGINAPIGYGSLLATNTGVLGGY